MKQLTFHESMSAYSKALTLFGQTTPSPFKTQEFIGQENFDLALQIYLDHDKSALDEDFIECMLDHIPAKEIAEAFYKRTKRESTQLYLKMKWAL